MAFKIRIDILDEYCDICRQRNTDKRPMLLLSTTGKSYDQRNFIWVHLDEFERKLAWAKKKHGKAES